MLYRLAWLWKYGGLYLDTDLLILQDIFSLNKSFVSLHSLAPEESFTSSVLKFSRHHPLLMDWIGKMGEEYDNTNKLIWGDKLTTSVALEYCSEELLVGGGREVGRRDDISVLIEANCQDNLRIIDHPILFPISKRDWKRIFISGTKDAKVR